MALITSGCVTGGILVFLFLVPHPNMVWMDSPDEAERKKVRTSLEHLPCPDTCVQTLGQTPVSIPPPRLRAHLACPPPRVPV